MIDKMSTTTRREKRTRSASKWSVVLIHEMTHVWQRQNGMNVKARGLGSLVRPYDYVLKPGKPFEKYSMEQQATIVGDYFLSLHGRREAKRYRGEGMRTVYPPSTYEALLPWTRSAVGGSQPKSDSQKR